jgi:hypothetical protein
MAQISDAVVEELAKRLAEKDGFEWQLELKLPIPDESRRRIRPILDDAGRERYTAMARQQLENGNA